MGAFFTNVQVRSHDRDAVVAAVRAHATTDATEVVDGSADEPDRTILVLPPDAGGWIAIYDERAESQDVAVLEAMAIAVSRATGAAALTVLVHDSDVLDLRLVERGERVDRLDTCPEFSGPVSATKRAAVAGHPERWAALTSDVEALREAWKADEVFAERTLARTAEILGIEDGRATTGFRYSSRGELGELPAGTVTLRVRSIERPPWETRSDGPVELVCDGGPTGTIDFAVGDVLRIGITTRSTGGAGRGLGMRAWGSVVDDGLVEITAFESVRLDPNGGRPTVTTWEAHATRSVDGHPMRVADAPEVEIPAGPAALGGYRPGMDVARMMADHARTRVHVNALGRFVSPGEGELCVGLVPLERLDGDAGMRVALRISPPLRSPLRAASYEGSSAHLRPLAGDTHLVAVVVLDGSRADLVPLVRALIDAAAVAPTTAVESTIVVGGARPKIGRGKAKTMLGPKRVDALLEALGATAEISLRAGALVLAAGEGLLQREGRAPTLMASLDGPPDELPQRRERLTTLIDALARRGVVLQATLHRTGWTPSSFVDHTPYETACGISHGVSVRRSWCERWLRVPGDDRLWLSPSLVAHVDRAALEALGELDAVGPTSRFTARDRAQVAALEAALAPILPSAEDALGHLRSLLPT